MAYAPLPAGLTVTPSPFSAIVLGTTIPGQPSGVFLELPLPVPYIPLPTTLLPAIPSGVFII